MLQGLDTPHAATPSASATVPSAAPRSEAAAVNAATPGSAALVNLPGANPDIALRLATGKSLVTHRGNLSPAYLFVKRAMDIVGAAVLIVMLSPLMLLTLLVLTITTQGKPLFYQERIGLCGRAFRMWKFRTMHVNADKMQHLVQNEKDGPIFKNRRDPRVTRIGRILRSFSIDETPQLFSVLLGDMALVGPRPPVAKEVVKYTPQQLNRLAIKPGLTCLWQVSGRSEIGFEDWVKMDLWYLEHQNLWTDLVLLLRTPWSVISRRGAY